MATKIGTAARAGDSAAENAPSASGAHSVGAGGSGGRKKGKGKAGKNRRGSAPAQGQNNQQRDKEKGKAKAPPGAQEKSDEGRTSPSSPTEATTGAVACTEGGDTVESICWICAEPVKYYSVSRCNHRTCHVCALRVRALYEKLDCAFCKEPQQVVIFTATERPYADYDLESIVHRYDKLSIYFETREMMEDTLVLLKFNCPDPDCDHIGNGWKDLKLHTRVVHGRLICDLCIRNRKVFAHEHVLYPTNVLPVHLPSMNQRHRANISEEQVEGGIHPMCRFCHECFFGDDELHAHCRERHEACFICKRNGIRNQYFRDYGSLDQNFHETHHPCTQPQCLARNFVIFDSVLDLKAHMVEEHGGAMSPKDRRNVRHVADFASEDAGGRYDHRRRDHEREGEREPPPPSSPTISRPQPTGQSRAREAFGARLTVDGVPITQSAPSRPNTLEANLTSTLGTDNACPAVAERHSALTPHLQRLVMNPTATVPTAKAVMRGYHVSESSARDLISTIWNISNENLEQTASIIYAFVAFLDDGEKKEDLLASWNGFVIERCGQSPGLVPATVSENHAAIPSPRILNAKQSTNARSSQESSRAVWDRLTQAASSSSAPSASSSPLNNFSALEPFPALLSSSQRPSQGQRTSQWTSSGAGSIVGIGSATTTSPSLVPPKKSWASLLKSSNSSSSSSRNTLSTSNVVGSSIPASTPNHDYAFGEPSSSGTANEKKKADLIALLSSSGSLPTATATTTATRIRPRGLVDSGNMYFANAVLQMLVYTPPFQKLFVELGRLKGAKDNKGKKKSTDKTPLVDAMIEFVKEFVVDDVCSANGSGLADGWGGGNEMESEDGSQDSSEDEGMWEGESFIPTYVYNALKKKRRFDNMWGGQQGDAEEFLGFLLETLDEELVLLREEATGRRHTLQTPFGPVEETEETAPLEEQGWQEVGKRNRTVVTRTIQSSETPISKIFGGKFRTTLRVPYTNIDSVIVEHWRSVRLDIQRDRIYTVQDALSYIFHPQLVRVTHPDRPGTTLEAQQQVHIDALPPILILHIKRFCYDTDVGRIVKVGKQVWFGPELDIVNDVLAPGIRKSWSPKYKLFGVLYHHGLSSSSGYYTLDVLHPTRYAGVGGDVKAREGWVRIHDELVSDVRHEDVFRDWDWDDSGSPYLLFYRRVR